MKSKQSAMQGILRIHKPRGKTSFFLVSAMRRLFNEKTVGHAGTLDPFATGVMILLIGRAYTKLSNSFLQTEKEYVARLLLGKATDTFDCDGTLTHTSPLIPSLEQVHEVLSCFQGSLLQTPPMFSAKKIQGQPLYKLARQGKEVERPACPIHLKTVLLSYNYPHLDIQVTCSKGTYIRSLAHEIGLNLGTYAHLTHLIRTRSGSITLDQCLNFELFSLQSGTKELFSQSQAGYLLPAQEFLCSKNFDLSNPLIKNKSLD